LVLEHDDEWHVLLLGGTKWGTKERNTLETVPVKDFDEGKEVYDKMFVELREDGWRSNSMPVIL
jgi:hypothetical protein